MALSAEKHCGCRIYFSAEGSVKEDILWSIFAESGCIEDYLRYSASKDENHDDC